MAATRQSFYSTESDHQDPAYDDDHVGRLDVIDQINQDLAGKTYFEKPKVTKEVMVATLKAQNKLLMIANVNLENVVRRLTRVEEVAKNAKEHADVLQAQVNTNKDKLATAEYQIKDLTANNMSLKAKLETVESEVDKLKAEVKGRNQMLADDIKAMEASMAEMKDMSQDVLQKIDDLAAEMELNTDKVMYRRELTDAAAAAAAAAAGGPAAEEDSQGVLAVEVPLTEVLRELEGLVAEQRLLQAQQRGQLKLHGAELAQKAPLLVAEDVRRHEEDLERIRKKVFDQEVVDLMDVRKRQEAQTEALDAIQRELIQKIDRQAVDEKVEAKYAEIIDHLQGALKASEDDEEEFKKNTADLYNTVEALRKGKADRRELADLRSLLLANTRAGGGGGGNGAGGGDAPAQNPRTGSPMAPHKAAAGGGGGGALNGAGGVPAGGDPGAGVTKEELFVLLEEKVDRAELDRRLNTAMRTINQMNRSRLALTSSRGGGTPGWEGGGGGGPGGRTAAAGGAAEAGGHLPAPPTAGLWAGLASALRPVEGGPPPMPQGALAIAKGYTYNPASRPPLPGGPGVCLACQGPVVNAGAGGGGALRPGVALGGGYQVWTEKKPALRTPSPGDTLPDLEERRVGKMLVGTDGNLYVGDRGRRKGHNNKTHLSRSTTDLNSARLVDRSESPVTRPGTGTNNKHQHHQSASEVS